MTTDEFVIKLKNFRSTLPEVRDKAIIDAVFSGAALAKRRIIGSRMNAQEGIFGIYSPNYLKKRIKAGKGPDPKINFSYTGKMWQSTQPVLVSSTEDEVRIRVAPVDVTRNRIMGYHDDRFGEIMELSQEEIDLIIDVFHEELQKVIDNSF